jgi:hypothetical protein
MSRRGGGHLDGGMPRENHPPGARAGSASLRPGVSHQCVPSAKPGAIVTVSGSPSSRCVSPQRNVCWPMLRANINVRCVV